MKNIFTALCASLLLAALMVSCGDADKFFTDQTRDTSTEFDLPMVNLSLYSNSLEYEGDSIVVEDGEDQPDTSAGYTDTYVALNSTWLQVPTTTTVSNSAFDLKDSQSRVIIPDMSYEEWSVSDMKNCIYVNGILALEDYNVEIRTYYNGIAVKVKESYYAPLVLYAGDTSETVEISTIYTGSDVPLGTTVDKILLRRGYQVVVAASEDGTLSSVCYIAVDNDVEITLDSTLKGQIKFLRALAIQYVSKQGICGKSYHTYHEGLDLPWFYTWGTADNLGDESTNFLPMYWSGNSCTTENNELIIEKQYPLLMAFNEPDNSDQANMSVDAAVEYYRDLHKLGVRLGAPSTEQVGSGTTTAWATGTTQWIHLFMEKIKEEGLRVDVMGFHWYDVGYASGLTATTAANSSPGRLNACINACYQRYGLPIIITEFNCGTAAVIGKEDVDRWIVSKGFFQNVVPLLEANDYVERYAMFPPHSSIYGTGTDSSGNSFTKGVVDLVDGAYVLNENGESYRISNSAPSIVVAATDKK